jgi:hypothetical protein
MLIQILGTVLLLALALLFGSQSMRGLKTKRITSRRGSKHKSERPFAYWFSIFVYSILSIGFAIMAVKTALGWMVLSPEASEALSVKEPDKRSAAADKQSLSRLNIARKKNIDTESATTALKSKDPSTRWIAAKRLGEHRKREAVVMLIAALEDPERSVREQAAQSLDKLIGLKVPEVIVNQGQEMSPALEKIKQWWKANQDQSIDALRLAALKKKAQ